MTPTAVYNPPEVSAFGTWVPSVPPSKSMYLNGAAGIFFPKLAPAMLVVCLCEIDNTEELLILGGVAKQTPPTEKEYIDKAMIVATCFLFMYMSNLPFNFRVYCRLFQKRQFSVVCHHYYSNYNLNPALTDA
ncbi:hypothetical protein JCM39068_37680 [Desulfocastanea catecholica]